MGNSGSTPSGNKSSRKSKTDKGKSKAKDIPTLSNSRTRNSAERKLRHAKSQPTYLLPTSSIEYLEVQSPDPDSEVNTEVEGSGVFPSTPISRVSSRDRDQDRDQSESAPGESSKKSNGGDSKWEDVDSDNGEAASQDRVESAKSSKWSLRKQDKDKKKKQGKEESIDTKSKEKAEKKEKGKKRKKDKRKIGKHLHREPKTPLGKALRRRLSFASDKGRRGMGKSRHTEQGVSVNAEPLKTYEEPRGKLNNSKHMTVEFKVHLWRDKYEGEGKTERIWNLLHRRRGRKLVKSIIDLQTASLRSLRRMATA